MSGYLHRLVARHAEEPSVRLRAVSRFEGDLVAGLVDTEGLASAAPAVPVEAIAVSVGAREEPAPRQRLPRDHGAAGHQSATGAERPPAAAARPPQLQRDDASSADGAEPTLPPATARLAPRPGEPSTAIEPRVAAQAARLTSSGARRGLLEQPGATGAPVGRRLAASAPHREPDVVQVHIGRVEVRAVVAAHEPARPAARPARPAPLSLDQYLSGERRR